MGLAISPLKDFALSVSADHQIVKYNLSVPPTTLFFSPWRFTDDSF